MFENVISIEIEFFNNNSSLYFKYCSQQWKEVLSYLYKGELLYLWPDQTGLSINYKNYFQRNLVLAITEKLLDHSVQLEYYETYFDFLENSEMKENEDWDIANTLDQETVLCLQMGLVVTVLEDFEWHLRVLK